MSTSLKLIDKRRRMVNMNTTSTNRPNIDSIRSPISLNTMESFLCNINNNVDINFFGTQIFDKYSVFAKDNEDNPSHVEKIQKYIKEKLLEEIYNEHIFYRGKETIIFSSFEENSSLIGAAIFPIVDSLF